MPESDRPAQAVEWLIDIRWREIGGSGFLVFDFEQQDAGSEQEKQHFCPSVLSGIDQPTGPSCWTVGRLAGWRSLQGELEAAKSRRETGDFLDS
jgi:hypothetical protein